MLPDDVFRGDKVKGKREARISFGVRGMTCAGCVRTVEKAIESIPGVVSVKVNLTTESAEVNAIQQEGINIAKEIAKKVEEKGYKVVPNEVVFLCDLSYTIPPEEIEKTLKNSDGVLDAHVSRGTGEIKVEYLSPLTTPEKLKKSIESLGIPVEEVDVRDIYLAEKEKKIFEKEVRDLRIRFFVALPFTLFFILDMLLGFFGFLESSPGILRHSGILKFLLATPPVVVGLQKFAKGFFKKIRTFSFDMNFLVSMGISIAYISSAVEVFFPSFFPSEFSFFDGAVFISTFMLLGRMIEAKVRKNTVYAIRKLLELQPEKTKVLVGGQEQIKNSDEVSPGDEVILAKGDRVSHDGVVASGKVLVDESHITGELNPVEKKKGDKVFAGSLVIEGGGTMKVEVPYDKTTLRKMIDILKESQLKKTGVERLADKVSGVFVPIVIFIAFLFFAVWLLVQGDFVFALERMISVLVVACPCALGLATPTAIATAVGRASESGIWIKNASAIENIPKTKIAMFDKTGTITQGRPTVKKIVSFDCDEKEVLFFAGSVELTSNHPISKAIVEEAKKRGIQLEKPSFAFSIEGKGVVGKIRGKEVAVGNEKLMREVKVVQEIDVMHSEDAKQKVKSISSQSEEGNRTDAKYEGTPVFVSVEKKLKGVIFVEDEVREEAVFCIRELKKKGVKVFIITGDKKGSAEKVRKTVGADGVFAELLPDEKVEVIKKVKRETTDGKVMMVGDGINDAPSLETADIGVAVGSSSEITKIVSDIVVKDIRSIPYILKLGEKTFSVIKQNLFWAFAYNIALIPLAGGMFYPLFGIYLRPVFSAIAMSSSSIIVTLNSLRLKKMKID